MSSDQILLSPLDFEETQKVSCQREAGTDDQERGNLTSEGICICDHI